MSTRFCGQSWTVSFGMVKGSVRAPRNPGGSWAYRIDLPAVRGQARRQVQVGGFASEADARSALAEALAEYEADRPVRRAPDTVGGFLLDRWLRGIRREVADSALSNYSTIVATYVVPRIGDVRLSRLSTRQVDQLYADLLENGARDGRPLSATTVGQVHRTLRRAFNDAVRWGLINANPVTAAKVPRPTPRMLSIWTPEQSTLFLESVRTDRLFALWLVALHTGMRRGELAGLRWRDVDLVSGKVSIVLQRTTDGFRVVLVEPKAGSRRVVQLAAEVVVRLRAHRDRQAAEREGLGLGLPGPDDAVFADEAGQAYHPQRLRVMFGRASERAGLPVIRLHDLRHTMATTALTAGIHPKIVQERLGHTTVAMTLDTYSHVTDTIQTEAAEELHRVMSPPAPASDGRNPLIGETLEESPEALRAAARPMTSKKRRHRRPTAADEAFVNAIMDA
jgi:integrase